jgi:hypothetical protein
MDAPITRTGKIGRCPPHIRDEVNRRLLNGEPASKILPWLNGQEVVLRILDEYFHEEPVTPQNLSEWRQGGFADWLKRRERLANLKELSAYAATLGEAAGGNATDGSAAILGGRILEKIETALDENDDATLAALVKPLVLLRGTDLEARKSKQRERLLDQKERQIVLEEARFQRTTAELFLKFYDDKRAAEIASGKGRKEVKIEELRKVMFPQLEPLNPIPLNAPKAKQ